MMEAYPFLSRMQAKAGRRISWWVVIVEIPFLIVFVLLALLIAVSGVIGHFSGGSPRDLPEIAGLAALFAAPAGAAAWLIWRLRRHSGEARQALRWAILQLGDFDSVAIEIESDFAGREVTRSPIQVGRKWLCYVRGDVAVARRLEAFTWIHGERAVSRLFVIVPQLTLWTRFGPDINLPMRLAHLNTCLAEIARAAPWLPVGYSPAIENTWNTDRAELIQAVDQARADGVAFARAVPAEVEFSALKPPVISSLTCVLIWIGALAFVGTLFWLQYRIYG